jgi:steroid delta-isomerase
MSQEEIRQLITTYFAATRAMDPETWINTFAEDAVSYDPVDAVPIEGHQGLRRYFQDIALAFEKIGVTEDHVFITGDQAAVKWTGHGVGLNGREVRFEGIDVFEVNDQGKIQRMWGYWNPTAVLAELMS